MREIKFRAWDKKEEEIINNIHEINPSFTTGPQIFFLNKYLEDDNFEVMQYTGLLDKNGKEIYEGDVLEWEERRVIDSRVVEFDDGGFWIIGKKNEPWRERFMPSEATREIIGNIYENPDLIKK